MPPKYLNLFWDSELSVVFNRNKMTDVFAVCNVHFFSKNVNKITRREKEGVYTFF